MITSGTYRGSMQKSIISLVATGGTMQYRAVIPHQQCSLLPMVTIAELFTSLPFVKIGQQLSLFLTFKSFDADNVTDSTQDGFSTRLRMIEYDWVGLGRCCVIRWSAAWCCSSATTPTRRS